MDWDVDFANTKNVIDGAEVGLDDHGQPSYAPNSDAQDQDQVKEMLQWFREAIPNLTEAGLIHDICRFFQLVTEDKFPLTNISLLLFLDTVNFFSCGNICAMRYRKETLLYWLFGYLCFHGKWLRFSRGLKFSGCAVNDPAQIGHFSPSQNSAINFAVPADSVLQKYLEHNIRMPRFGKPGLITEMLNSIPMDVRRKEQFVLSFDCKLIRSGLTKEDGDIDMGGIESKPTFQELKDRLKSETDVVKELEMEILKLDGNPVLSLLSIEIVQRLIGKLQAVVKIVTLRIKDVRKMRQAKEYNIKCMIDSVGGEKR